MASQRGADAPKRAGSGVFGKGTHNPTAAAPTADASRKDSGKAGSSPPAPTNDPAAAALIDSSEPTIKPLLVEESDPVVRKMASGDFKLAREEFLFYCVAESDVGAVEKVIAKQKSAQEANVPAQKKAGQFLWSNQTDQGKTTLHKVCETGSVAMFNLLVKHLGGLTTEGTSEADYIQSVLSLRDRNGWTPLHYASYHSHPELVALIIDHHPKLAANKDKIGRTPLYLALIGGNREIASKLVAARSDLDPIFSALLGGDDGRLDDILSTDNSNKIADFNLHAVHFAACNKSSFYLRKLLQFGADVLVADDSGKTALHVAAATGSVDCVNFLLDNTDEQDHQIDINCVDKKKKAPIHFAARFARALQFKTMAFIILIIIYYLFLFLSPPNCIIQSSASIDSTALVFYLPAARELTLLMRLDLPLSTVLVCMALRLLQTCC
jgi:ankyrin repeat protein